MAKQRQIIRTMPTLTVTISRQQTDWLKIESTRLGISVSEVARRAIDAAQRSDGQYLNAYKK